MKIAIGLPIQRYFQNNLNFYNFSQKSAHFYKYQFNGLSNCNLDIGHQILKSAVLEASSLRVFYMDI